jgi:hypothetical protein
MHATVWEPLDNTGEVIEHMGLFFLKITYCRPFKDVVDRD